VEPLNSKKEAKMPWAKRRFVRVAPPSRQAAIGDALRHAFPMDGEMRSLKPFEDLLARLG
jgi:hypothetical protein